MAADYGKYDPRVGIMPETTWYEDVVGTKGEANSIGSRWSGRAESTEGGSDGGGRPDSV